MSFKDRSSRHNAIGHRAISVGEIPLLAGISRRDGIALTAQSANPKIKGRRGRLISPVDQGIRRSGHEIRFDPPVH